MQELKNIIAKIQKRVGLNQETRSRGRARGAVDEKPMEKPVEHETEKTRQRLSFPTTFWCTPRHLKFNSTEMDAEELRSEQTRVARHFQRSKSVLHDIHKHRLTNSINRSVDLRRGDRFRLRLFHVFRFTFRCFIFLGF